MWFIETIFVNCGSMAMIRKILLLLFLFYGSRVEAVYYRGGDLTFSVNGNTVNFNLAIYTQGMINVFDSLDIQNGTGSETWVYLISDTLIDGIYKREYVGSQQYPGAGFYEITAYFANRVSAICNIPGSLNEPMCLHATLVISPFFSYTSSPMFANDHFNKTIISDTIIHETGAYDLESDSLSFELVECAGESCDPISGYAFPNGFSGFEYIDTNGILVYSIPLQCKMQFAIKVTKWRMGVELCSAYRDILLENYWVGVNETENLSQLKLFPNPATESVFLQVQSKRNYNELIDIYNVIGKLVFSTPHTFTIGENEINLDVSHLSNGIYFVRMDEGNVVGRFVKN